MTKALQVIQDFAYEHSARCKAYTGQVQGLNLPWGFKPDHVIRIEKDNRPLILVTLTTEKYHIIKIASSELADLYASEIEHKLQTKGVKKA